MSLILSGTDGVQDNSGAIVRDTAKVATGTSVDFTSIPSWVKQVTVMLDGVSLSGTDDLLVQLGDSGGLETSGYVARGGNATTAPAVAVTNSTSGYPIRIAAAGNAFIGSMVISNTTGNTWVASYVGHTSATSLSLGSGVKTLSATLDRVSVTRTGTDTFDAGTINIIYE